MQPDQSSEKPSFFGSIGLSRLKAPKKILVRGESLRVNFSWTLLGTIVYAGCQWGVLVAIAKFGTQEMVGQFALALAITAPLVLLANLQLRSVQVTDTKGEFAFREYAALRFATTLVVLVLLIAIVMIGNFPRESALVVLIVGIGKGFDSVSDIVYGFFQQRNDFATVAKATAANGILSLLAVAIAMYFTSSIVSAVIAWSMASFATACWCWKLVRAVDDSGRKTQLVDGGTHCTFSSWRAHHNFARLLRLASISLPLGASSLLVSLNTNIPRYFIDQWFDSSELGIFAALAYFGLLGGVVVGALGQAATPALAKLYFGGNWSAFMRLLGMLCGSAGIFGALCIVTAAAFGESILTAVYSPEYAGQTGVFVVLMLGALLSYVSGLLGCALTAARKFKPSLYVSVLTTLATLSASFVVIPSHGALGASWVLVIAGAFGAVARVLVLSRSEKYEITTVAKTAG